LQFKRTYHGQSIFKYRNDFAEINDWSRGSEITADLPFLKY